MHAASHPLPALIMPHCKAMVAAVNRHASAESNGQYAWKVNCICMMALNHNPWADAWVLAAEGGLRVAKHSVAELRTRTGRGLPCQGCR
jgi:hypothetical protein